MNIEIPILLHGERGVNKFKNKRAGTGKENTELFSSIPKMLTLQNPNPIR